jgi:hypothetical protein
MVELMQSINNNKKYVRFIKKTFFRASILSCAYFLTNGFTIVNENELFLNVKAFRLRHILFLLEVLLCYSVTQKNYY